MMACSICEEEMIDLGNNAEPINSGRCCDLCNEVFVIPYRITQIFESERG